MKKHVFGKKLKRDANERKALFRGLLIDLVLNEQLITTEAKARAVKPTAEKLITKAKLRGKESQQFLLPYLIPVAVEKVLTDLVIRFEKRPGGYTRIIKLGNRFSDNAPMAVLEWTEKKGRVVRGPRNSSGEKVESTTAVARTSASGGSKAKPSAVQHLAKQSQTKKSTTVKKPAAKPTKEKKAPKSSKSKKSK